MVFSIQNIFYLWEQYGLYDFVLPFLLVFVLVYGILVYMNMFKGQKGLAVLIAAVLGLMSVRLPFMADFLKEVSPRLGVGLIVLLTILILIGLFIPDKSQAVMGWILLGVAVVIALVIFGQVADAVGWGLGGYLGDDLIAGLLLVGLLIGIIVAIVTAGSGGNADKSNVLGPFFKTK